MFTDLWEYAYLAIDLWEPNFYVIGWVLVYWKIGWVLIYWKGPKIYGDIIDRSNLHFVSSWLDFIYQINRNMLNNKLTNSNANIITGRAFVAKGLTANVSYVSWD